MIPVVLMGSISVPVTDCHKNLDLVATGQPHFMLMTLVPLFFFLSAHVEEVTWESIDRGHFGNTQPTTEVFCPPKKKVCQRPCLCLSCSGDLITFGG